MNEDMMTEAERASIAADGTDGLLGKRGKGVFHIHTLGCQMNVHDSERIAGVLSHGEQRQHQAEHAHGQRPNSTRMRCATLSSGRDSLAMPALATAWGMP